MPWFYNGYIHLTQAAALGPWLRATSDAWVLEVGCGVGRWSRVLARSGASVVGIDLASTMIAEARRRARAEGVADCCEFVQGDVAELDLGVRFDLIVCVTVLQHIVDAERMHRALDSMRVHLAPTGRLLLLEAAPSSGDARCDTATFTARTESVLHEAFARAGLRCLSTRGVDPMPLKTWFLPLYGRLPRPIALAALAAITSISLPCDLALARVLTRRSWHKVFVLSRA
jgi:ubiquinone/menaquinone biosynthesis C-methylase UbiE